jgi:hypothetical protein
VAPFGPISPSAFQRNLRSEALHALPAAGIRTSPVLRVMQAVIVAGSLPAPKARPPTVAAPARQAATPATTRRMAPRLPAVSPVPGLSGVEAENATQALADEHRNVDYRPMHSPRHAILAARSA